MSTPTPSDPFDLAAMREAVQTFDFTPGSTEPMARAQAVDVADALIRAGTWADCGTILDEVAGDHLLTRYVVAELDRRATAVDQARHLVDATIARNQP